MKLIDRFRYSSFFHLGAGEKGGLVHLQKIRNSYKKKMEWPITQTKIKAKVNIHHIIGGKYT